MNWLIWRQHRKQFVFAAIALLVFAAIAIPFGLKVSHTYHNALATCSQTASCANLDNILFQGDGALFDFMALVPIAIPMLLGLFWGAPLIAKEYETGTNKLVWTQGVTRRAWLTANLLWMLSAAVVYGLIVAAISTWWAKTPNALFLSRFSPLNFDAQALMPIVYSLFAVSVGVMIGAWFKKVLLALAVTLGVLVAVQVGVSLLVRPHYVPAQIQRVSIAQDRKPDGAVWVLGEAAVGPDDKTVNLAEPNATCGSVDGKQSIERTNSFVTCLAAHGYKWKTTYQPADRYWKFQEIEAALYVAASAIPIMITYAFVLKRDA